MVGGHWRLVGFDPGRLALHMRDQFDQCRPVYQLYAVVDGKGDCRCGKFPTAHDHPVISLMSGHDAEMLAYNRHADLVRAPMLALHQRVFACTRQGEINAVIRPRPSVLFHLITLLPVSFSNELFEFVPGE